MALGLNNIQLQTLHSLEGYIWLQADLSRTVTALLETSYSTQGLDQGLAAHLDALQIQLDQLERESLALSLLASGL